MCESTARSMNCNIIIAHHDNLFIVNNFKLVSTYLTHFNQILIMINRVKKMSNKKMVCLTLITEEHMQIIVDSHNDNNVVLIQVNNVGVKDNIIKN